MQETNGVQHDADGVIWDDDGERPATPDDGIPPSLRRPCQTQRSYQMSKMNRAMLARAEQIIDLLRTRYVRQDWKLDEEAAERMLQYFRHCAAGVSVHGREWMAVVTFCGEHGQSLDWIVMGNPGGMICGGAAHSARTAALGLHSVGE
jgi:hypothetical protein